MCVRGGVVQDGHGEKVRESQTQVHYDYKNYWRSMMRKFSLMLLAFSVYADDEKAVVVGSAEELRGITMDSGL